MSLVTLNVLPAYTAPVSVLIPVTARPLLSFVSLVTVSVSLANNAPVSVLIPSTRKPAFSVASALIVAVVPTIKPDFTIKSLVIDVSAIF